MQNLQATLTYISITRNKYAICTTLTFSKYEKHACSNKAVSNNLKIYENIVIELQSKIYNYFYLF